MKQNINYNKKYIKYKNKYLQAIKNMQIGGMRITEKHKQIITDELLLEFQQLLATITDKLKYTQLFEQITDKLKSLKNDLWMIIGASNYYDYDLDRFAEEYDISITDDNIDTTNIQLLSLKPKTPAGNNIYEYLSTLLPGKFSKIIYDWSTIKFIKIHDLYAHDLPNIKTLMSPGGKLYINSFDHDYTIVIAEHVPHKADQYRLTNVIVDPPSKENIINTYQGVIITGKIVYDVSSTLSNMDEKTGVFTISTEEILRLYGTNAEYKKSQDAQNSEKHINNLKTIFTEDDYNVQHITTDESQKYLNNPIKKNHTPTKFYLITRN